MFGTGSSFGLAGCGRYRALEYEPAMPPASTIRQMRRRDMTMPPRRSSALIFPAPYTLPLSRHTRPTSSSWGSARSVSGWSSIQQWVDLATPRILHCADIGQRPASDRITPAFVRIPAPLVLKRPPPSPTDGCVSAMRAARSARACGRRRPWSSRCCGSPAPTGAGWNGRCRTPS